MATEGNDNDNNDGRIQKIGDLLSDTSLPLKARFRALFTLKNIGGNLSVDLISACFTDTSDLLKHECAYCLGQMQNPTAIPCLVGVLNDLKQAVIVRHEAAEALGAIGDKKVIRSLTKHIKDPDQSIRETCELSISLLKWLQYAEDDPPATLNPFDTVDPAPSCSHLNQNLDRGEKVNYVQALADEMYSVSEPLFCRYRAMFSLRNIGNEPSILHLAKGLTCLSSALFRHEVAFVLGQSKHRAAVKPLIKCLANVREHAMVRHECAEALGAIATEECEIALRKYLKCKVRVVRESCEVALDMCEYECDGVFQYADGLNATAPK